MANLLTVATSLTRQCLSILGFKEFDTGTPEGRSKERYRRVALAAMASVGAKAVSVITMLITVPLTLHYLGVERYGMWMTISSVIMMLGFANLGLGNGLMNAIAESHGKDDREAAAGYVSSAFVLLFGVAAALLLIFFLVYPFVPWPKVFNVSSASAARESGPAMAAFMVCFGINLPLGLVNRVQLGYQEGFVNSLWEVLGSVLGLLGVLLVIYRQGGLVWLVLAMAAAPALAALLNGLVLFIYQRPYLLPRWRHISRLHTRRILHLGLLFFVLQVATTLSFASDNFVAAQILGPQAVVKYSIASRLFSPINLLMVMFIAPLWPAYSEAIVRRDLAWIKKTLRGSLLLTLLFTVIPSLVLIILGSRIIALWVGEGLAIPFLLIVGLGLWSVINSVGQAFAMFLNGLNIIKLQVICAVFMSIGSILLKIFFSKAFGITGIIWGTIVAYIICALIPYLYYIKHILKGLTYYDKSYL